MLSFFCLQYFKNRNSLKATKILTNLLNCEIVFFWRDIAFRQRKVLNHLSKFSLSWILLFETFQFECFFNSNLFSWIYWLAHSWNPEIECLKSAQSCQKLSYELRHCSIFIGPIIALPCQSLSSLCYVDMLLLFYYFFLPSAKQNQAENFTSCWTFSSQLKLFNRSVVALCNTQNESIQSLNFGKSWFNSISDSIMADQNSIQTFIQLKKIGGDSIQSMIQFKCQGIINTGQTSIHFHHFAWIRFKRLFNIIFPEHSIQKIIQLPFFLEKYLNFDFGCIQFSKIFIQLENPGIAHP